MCGKYAEVDADCVYHQRYRGTDLFAAGNLASTYYELNQLDLAILHYKQAINYDSAYVEAYNNLVSFSFLNSNLYYNLLSKELLANKNNLF